MEKLIGIVGYGVVGGAVKNFFQDAFVYDAYRHIDPWDKVARMNYIFICVPTPYNNGFDASAIEETLEKLKDKNGKIIIIKSTVLPKTTQTLQEKYPLLNILFNPEFLDNKTSYEDFMHPDKQIVGYTEKSKDVAQEVLDMLPKSPYMKIMPAAEAEMVKYMVNSYYATKVIFANKIYDICEKLGIGYNTVREGFEQDRRVAPGNFDVWHGGGSGV